jgi:hypothetical protein
MSRESYPVPGQPLKLVRTNDSPAPTREQWEERVFRQADHFNVVRFTPTEGKFLSSGLKTFAEALYMATRINAGDRVFIYAVNALGEAFSIAAKDYAKFAEITLKLRGDQRPYCSRCQTVIRPEGGHLCGDCGRNI